MENTSHDISWGTGAVRPLFHGFAIKQKLKFHDISPIHSRTTSRIVETAWLFRVLLCIGLIILWEAL